MKRLLKFVGWTVAGLIGALALLFLYLVVVTDLEEPAVPAQVAGSLEVHADGLRTWGDNWFRQSESGLYEMSVAGDAYERGYIIGQLSGELIQYQEEVFNAQIRRLVPSPGYLRFLKYFVGWFNRDLDDSVPVEYRHEILGVSSAASHEFDYIAPPYQRILNYHAAHDIGHALQNMALVGCTAFATWDDASEDGNLIVGRNFDFYVGDDFARNKIVAFYRPTSGHRFMMVTFGGMTGVLSGMNEHGLTVTLNAAKSEIPSGSATPVSIVAREILQYAKTIDEAYAIARKRKTFVAEAFLIGSAIDGFAAIIEKSPSGIGLFRSDKNYIVGANHFQSDSLGSTELNREHMAGSASVYRQERVEELLSATGKNTVAKTVTLLRDQRGKGNANIGYGNERAVNQLIAHHAIVFLPRQKKVWVSTAPYQLGKFVCYDLDSVFGTTLTSNREIFEAEETIPADTFVNTAMFHEAVKFNRYRFPFQPRDDMHPDSLIRWNPESYLSYMLAGDWYADHVDYASAIRCYEAGLEKEVATAHEREHMEKMRNKCLEEIKK